MIQAFFRLKNDESTLDQALASGIILDTKTSVKLSDLGSIPNDLKDKILESGSDVEYSIHLQEAQPGCKTRYLYLNTLNRDWYCVDLTD